MKRIKKDRAINFEYDGKNVKTEFECLTDTLIKLFNDINAGRAKPERLFSILPKYEGDAEDHFYKRTHDEQWETAKIEAGYMKNIENIAVSTGHTVDFILNSFIAQALTMNQLWTYNLDKEGFKEHIKQQNKGM